MLIIKRTIKNISKSGTELYISFVDGTKCKIVVSASDALAMKISGVITSRIIGSNSNVVQNGNVFTNEMTILTTEGSIYLEWSGRNDRRLSGTHEQIFQVV